MSKRQLMGILVASMIASAGVTAQPIERPDQYTRATGFAVSLSVNNDGSHDQDTAWEHVSGGALMIEHVETTLGEDKFHKGTTLHLSDVVMKIAALDVLNRRATIEIGPCPFSISDICLQLTGARLPDDFRAWFSLLVQTAGAPSHRINVTVSNDLLVKRSYYLIDCLPVRWTVDDVANSAIVQAETLTATCGRIDLVQ